MEREKRGKNGKIHGGIENCAEKRKKRKEKKKAITRKFKRSLGRRERHYNSQNHSPNYSKYRKCPWAETKPQLAVAVHMGSDGSTPSTVRSSGGFIERQR